jgi:hypothetical protein
MTVSRKAKANELTGDAKLLAYWATIKEPREMLRAIVENGDLLGYDPYYKDLREALLKQAEKIGYELTDQPTENSNDG